MYVTISDKFNLTVFYRDGPWLESAILISFFLIGKEAAYLINDEITHCTTNVAQGSGMRSSYIMLVIIFDEYSVEKKRFWVC